MQSSYIGARVIPQLVYHRPAETEEALALMRGSDPWAVVAGCTDFIPAVRKGAWRYPDGVNVIDIRDLPGFRGITLEQGTVRIGAATRLSDIVNSGIIEQSAPLLSEAVQWMASLQVRNTATLGGNLCTASPAADTAPPLLALQAKLEIVDKDGGSSEIPLSSFFSGPGKTECGSGKLLKSVYFPAQQENDRTYWRKMGIRQAFTISVITIAAKARMKDRICTDACLAFGSVAPTPMRALKTEELIRGKEITPELIEQASDLAQQEVSPISDLRASAQYRREMAGVLTKRALKGML